MDAEFTVKSGRYFWSDWVSAHSYGTLATVFVLLSAADLLATIQLIRTGTGIQEGNLLAASALIRHGHGGMIAYKSLLVFIILTAIWLVYQRNPRLATGVLWGANLLMGVIALIHLALIAGFIS